MFTGIIETTGRVADLEKIGENLNISVEAPFLPELKIDQSIAHDGVCLTVIDLKPNSYTVTAIAETLKKTRFRHLKTGDVLNLERCLKISDRLDGHIVQGHADQTGTLQSIENQQGSYFLTFAYEGNSLTVEKGSICVNGISLTVVNSRPNAFSAAIIPYTWEHTNLKHLEIGAEVNLEFDIIGKYVQRLMDTAI